MKARQGEQPYSESIADKSSHTNSREARRQNTAAALVARTARLESRHDTYEREKNFASVRRKSSEARSGSARACLAVLQPTKERRAVQDTTERRGRKLITIRRLAQDYTAWRYLRNSRHEHG